MPKTQIEEIAVASLTKFGFADANGKFVNYSRHCKDEDKLKVVPGVKFSAEIYVADSGTRYLNKVFKLLQSADPVKKVTEKPVVKAEVKSEDKPKTEVCKDAQSSTMTRQDWDAKDKRISRQGAIQAAVQAVATYSTQENILDNALELSEGMLKFVNEVK